MADEIKQFFRRIQLKPAVVSGHIASVTVDSATGQQLSALVTVGSNTIRVRLDPNTGTLANGDQVRLEQHGQSATAEYRLAGIEAGGRPNSGSFSILNDGTNLGGATYSGGDLIVGKLDEGNLFAEYATGRLYHRIGTSVYGINYPNGARLFGHAVKDADWTPDGPNVTIDASGIRLRNALVDALTIDGANGIRMYSGAVQRVWLKPDGSGWLGGADKFTWDTGGNVTLAGTITANSGSIAGWSIDAGKIYKTNAYLSSSGYISFGATPPAAYGNNVGAWLGYSGGAKLSLYADASNYLQWDGSKLLIHAANVSIDASGNLVARAGYFGDSSNRVAIEAAGLNVGASGSIRGGQTAYDTGTGFFLGYSAGAYKLSIGSASSGKSLTWDGSALRINGGIVTALGQGSEIAIEGWQCTCAFSASANDTVAWTSGSLVLTDGTTYSIAAGDTGDMTARTYIYFDKNASTTTLQKTTTASAAVGSGRILIATAINSTTEALYQVFSGAGGVQINGANIEPRSITASEIVAGTITANEIATGTITANQIAANTITAAKIAAGTITASEIAANTIVGNNISSLNLQSKNITADTGAVGGWTLGTTYLKAGSGANTVGLDSGGANPAFYAGGATPGSAPFQVSTAGVLTATGAIIRSAASGARIELNASQIVGTDGTNAQWYATSTDGKLYAGGGSVILDRLGVTIKNLTRSLRFLNDSAELGAVMAQVTTTQWNGSAAAGGLSKVVVEANGAGSGTELITNPSVETDTTGWTLAGTMLRAEAPESAPAGTYCLRSAVTDGYTGSAVSNNCACEAGNQLRVAFWYRHVHDGQYGLHDVVYSISFYNASNTLLEARTILVPAYSVAVDTGWLFFNTTLAAAPANTAYARFTITVTGGPMAIGYLYVYTDAVSVRVMSSAVTSLNVQQDGVVIEGPTYLKGDVQYSGTLKPVRNSTAYTGAVFVPLTTAKQHTSYDGDTVGVGTYQFNLQDTGWGLPAGIQAVAVRMSGKWASNAGDAYYALLRPKGGSYGGVLVRSHVANIYSDSSGIVPCDATDGDIELQVAGASATLHIDVWGYWL